MPKSYIIYSAGWWCRVFGIIDVFYCSNCYLLLTGFCIINTYFCHNDGSLGSHAMHPCHAQMAAMRRFINTIFRDVSADLHTVFDLMFLTTDEETIGTTLGLYIQFVY